MKLLKIVIITSLSVLICQLSSAQNYSDTILAKEYYALGDKFYGKNTDSSTIYYQNAANVYREVASSKNDTFLWGKYVRCMYDVAWNLTNQSEFDSALRELNETLKVCEKTLPENHIQKANIYNGLGRVYNSISVYNKALISYEKSLAIIEIFYGKKHTLTAKCYNNIGNTYTYKSEYNKAIECYQKSLFIYKETVGTEHSLVAAVYNNTGAVYLELGEYDKALEYNQNSTEIYKRLYGEKHAMVARGYNNIGTAHYWKSENSLALAYFTKSLNLRKELYGENHEIIARCYNNIGALYKNQEQYKKALEFYQKALDIDQKVYGESHTLIANSYNNIGAVYTKKLDNDKALKYLLKGLKVYKEVYGKHHTYVAMSYNNIGLVHQKKQEYDKALQYYQKSLVSNLKDFNETHKYSTIPQITNYTSWDELLTTLQNKAKVFADTSIALSNFNTEKRFMLAIEHFKACDELISEVRQNMKTKTDKLALGAKATLVYKEAVAVCLSIEKSEELAFYFSEQNKASVLLESLAGAEAMKFSGIPTELLEKEKNLKNNIALFKKTIAEDGDSLRIVEYKNLLFNNNRSYDSLIYAFEQNYPEYFELKYNYKPANIKKIQKNLDKKTTILSYLTDKNTITIFAISRKHFLATVVKKPRGFENKISNLRYDISNTESLQIEVLENTHESVNDYQKIAFEFYNLLFPKEIKDFLGKKTKNIILIPDGKLATVPFEALLTKEYSAEWISWKNKVYFSEMPYLIKDYNISYSYSSNLLYKTFSNKKQNKIEISELNDWLALAPVFDDTNTSGMALRTRKFSEQIRKSDTISIKTRAFTRDGMHISELPGSLKETETIFKLYENKKGKALLKTHLQANETLVKSGELSRYKYIHFATHGIVNEEKPELSGLILAQDTTSIEDNILFTGEIYNLNLNADLTVLSACETGLGKITKGEGVIGLTRALLYAGSKNIVVSLWQVSDASTNKLMVDFYSNFLKKKKVKKYSKHLRKAKLEMIKEGKYAHPFYWSPFILIGQ